MKGGVKHLWLNGWTIYVLNGWGSYGKLLFRLKIFSKNAGLQGSTLYCHCVTTGFNPFELLTCGLLQRGWDHSALKAFLWLSQCYEYTGTKTNVQ